jgi:hypothetical protein
MQQNIIEYKQLINHRLEENWKSFKILFNMKHYGNCISIMCQELDQMISILFILNRNEYEQNHLINLSANSHKWYFLDGENKKNYIVEKDLIEYADTFVGWEKSIYEFGLSFHKLSINYNYLLKDPILGMSDIEKKHISDYIKEYHDSNFNNEFGIQELVPFLENIFTSITQRIGTFLDKL